MPQKQDFTQLNQQQKKKYRYDFKNGIFEGNVAQYKRQGFGIVLLDDGYIYIGNWNNDKVHGRALLFIPNTGVLFGNFNKGMQVGSQIIRLYNFPNEYFCVEVKDPLKPPKNVLIYSRDTKSAVQATVRDDNQIECIGVKVTKEQEEQIIELDTFSMKFVSDFKFMKCSSLDGIRQIKIGYMSEPHFKLNGIGLVIDQDSLKILKQGQFLDDRLEGMGKMVMQNDDIYEGIFKGDLIDGKGFYYTAKTNSHVVGVFRREQCKEFISDGLDYPTNQIKKFKQTIHEGSINFYSSSFSARDFISIDWSYLLRFTDKQYFIKHESKRNSSPGMSTLLDKINTSNTFQNIQNTKTNTSQRDSFSSGYYSFQQNFQSGNQNNNSGNSNYNNPEELCKNTSSSINNSQMPPYYAQRRSNSINGYRIPHNNQFQSTHSSFQASNYSNINKFQSLQDQLNESLMHRKYSRKYIMANKEHQVENPEVQISNSQIDFGKLNWGTKPKGEDLAFSYTNYNLEKQGQDLYDQLSNDEVYKRESRINYFKNNGSIPSYEDTIKEGDLIKKRLQEMSDFDYIDERIPSNNFQRKNSGSAQKTQRSSQSQQATHRSMNFTSHSQNKQSLEIAPNSSQKDNKIYNNTNGMDTLKENNNGGINNIQNISDYLRNTAENNQESYLNQRIDASQLRYNQQNRHLIPYSPNLQGREGNESQQSQYSVQQDIKKRSQSVSSGNGAIITKSVVSSLDKKDEISPSNVTYSFDKTQLSKNIPQMVNQQIIYSNENIIRLQNLYDEKWKRSTSTESYPLQSNFQNNIFEQSQQKLQEQNKQEIIEQKQMNQSIPLHSLQYTSSTSQPMKFVKELGVPHSNKNDQLGIYLKMKEESINKQKEQQQHSQQAAQNALTNSNYDVTPISHSGSKVPSLDSSRMSILHSYMNPENFSLNNNPNNLQNDTFKNNNKLNLIDLNQLNNTQQGLPKDLQKPKDTMGYYIPQDKSNEYVFTFHNNNQSSVISNNSYNQIANEFEQNRPHSVIGLMKDRHKIKLNNILYFSKQQNSVNQNNTNLPQNNLSGYTSGVLTNRLQNQNNPSIPLSYIPPNTLPVHYGQTHSTDNSPYNISKTNPTLNEVEAISLKNKSMVRFDLSTDGSQRHQSFSYRRQHTPDKSSLKGNNKVSPNQQYANNNNSSFGSEQKANQRLSTSIDLSNKKYHYSDNPANLFYMNTLQKTQNQWIDLYSVNPQILANTSPQKTLQHRQVNHQIQNQQQYLPLLM